MTPAIPTAPQTLRAALAPATNPPPRARFTRAELALVTRLRTPAAVQAWLNALPYNAESGGETLRTFRGVVARGTAHCLEAALFAAVTLEQHGYPPLLMSLESVEVVVRGYRAFIDGDFEAIAGLLHDEIEWRIGDAWPEALLLAEGHLTRRLFGAMLQRI